MAFPRPAEFRLNWSLAPYCSCHHHWTARAGKLIQMNDCLLTDS